MTDGAWQKAAHRSAPNGKSISGERFSNLLRLIFHLTDKNSRLIAD